MSTRPGLTRSDNTQNIINAPVQSNNPFDTEPEQNNGQVLAAPADTNPFGSEPDNPQVLPPPPPEPEPSEKKDELSSGEIKEKFQSRRKEIKSILDYNNKNYSYTIKYTLATFNGKRLVKGVKIEIEGDIESVIKNSPSSLQTIYNLITQPLLFKVKNYNEFIEKSNRSTFETLNGSMEQMGGERNTEGMDENKFIYDKSNSSFCFKIKDIGGNKKMVEIYLTKLSFYTKDLSDIDIKEDINDFNLGYYFIKNVSPDALQNFDNEINETLSENKIINDYESFLKEYNGKSEEDKKNDEAKFNEETNKFLTEIRRKNYMVLSTYRTVKTQESNVDENNILNFNCNAVDSTDANESDNYKFAIDVEHINNYVISHRVNLLANFILQKLYEFSENRDVQKETKTKSDIDIKINIEGAADLYTKLSEKLKDISIGKDGELNKFPIIDIDKYEAGEADINVYNDTSKFFETYYIIMKLKDAYSEFKDDNDMKKIYADTNKKIQDLADEIEAYYKNNVEQNSKYKQLLLENEKLVNFNQAIIISGAYKTLKYNDVYPKQLKGLDEYGINKESMQEKTKDDFMDTIFNPIKLYYKNIQTKYKTNENLQLLKTWITNIVENFKVHKIVIRAQYANSTTSGASVGLSGSINTKLVEFQTILENINKNLTKEKISESVIDNLKEQIVEKSKIGVNATTGVVSGWGGSAAASQLTGTPISGGARKRTARNNRRRKNRTVNSRDFIVI